MARQVAVAVGVSHVEGLRPLNVTPGTAAFAQWATDQGFEVTVLDDDDGRKAVHAGDVFAVVKEAVAGGVERLFVFFSGHGMERGMGEDIWLLTDAPTDGSEAVSVAATQRDARFSGIPHVALFADACRTPLTERIDGLNGRSIFPMPKVKHHAGKVDTYYATAPGSPAYEPTDAADPYGIFTGCLLDALHGRVPEIVTPVTGGKAAYAVLADALETYLDAEVTMRAAKQQLVQWPDCLGTSRWEPDVIAWVAQQHAAPPPAPAPQPDMADDAADYAADYAAEDAPGSGASVSVMEPPLRRTLGLVADERLAAAETRAEDIAARPGRSHFETGIGISVTGGRIVSAYVGGKRFDPFDEDGNDHVRVSDTSPALPALVEVEVARGTVWVATLVVPRYVTTVTMGAAGADHVALVEIRADADRDRLAIARAAALSQVGRRDFLDDPDARDLLGRGNPSMAVLAAYAFDRMGRADDVLSVANACVANGVLPYDVALLAGLDGPTVPAYPLMSRGWVLADALPAGAEWLEYGRARLAPVPWTTFGELGGDALAAYGRT